MIDDPLLSRAGVHDLGDGQARWCVWAPETERVELVREGNPRLPMERLDRGFHAVTAAVGDGTTLYRYALDGAPPLADPASRWQPEGVSGPSAVVFPQRWTWDEGNWRGHERRDLVFYELHVGTFTPEGTFDAVIPRIDALRELGVTAIELMPVGQFPGERGWGYDVAFPSAPQHSYGGPEGLKRLVEACHRRGMAIFLDVVHNHFGPEGNVFAAYGPYFNDRYRTDWGPAINYDGPRADAVRDFALDNVRMWVRDYRFDGLRLDAADQIYDRSPTSIVAEMAEVARRESARLGRPCHLFAETDQNDAGRYLREPSAGGCGLDGHWNDDFHHAVHVVLTGETAGYYRDFAEGVPAVAKLYERVFVNDGIYSPFRDRRHGAPGIEFERDRFIAFVQNHDQIANGNAGDRYAATLDPARTRLAAGLLLLAPRLPLLFMGEEYGETNPFPYFCDYADPERTEAVRKGRAAEFAYFGRSREPHDPADPATRDAAVLGWSWDESNRAALRRLYGDLLRLRRERAGLRDFSPPIVQLRDALLLDVTRGDTRILFNLGPDERAIPEDLAGGRPVLRSEPTGSAGADLTMRPYEFVIQEAPPPAGSAR